MESRSVAQDRGAFQTPGSPVEPHGERADRAPDPSAAATTPRRVLIAGSRSWQDINAIRMRMSKLPPGAVIVHGGAPGADRMAGFLADDFGFTVEEHPAEWGKYGKRSGFLRNLEMLESGVDLVLAFWDGESRGTKHTIDQARKRGIPVEVVT